MSIPTNQEKTETKLNPRPLKKAVPRNSLFLVLVNLKLELER
jgi:hypothetical protein